MNKDTRQDTQKQAADASLDALLHGDGRPKHAVNVRAYITELENANADLREEIAAVECQDSHICESCPKRQTGGPS